MISPIDILNPTKMNNQNQISDKELYTRCKYYGSKALKWRGRFAGLLPEVFQRRLYKRRGFASIHEFAAKLCGMSKEAVDKVLRLDNKLSDKPALRSQLRSGAVGWSKLQVVAGVASAKTDKKWASKMDLSQKALEICVKEERSGQTRACKGAVDHASATGASVFSLKGEYQQTCHFHSSADLTAGAVADGEKENQRKNLSMKLDEDLISQLQVLKTKLEKQKGEKLEWNAVMTELLAARTERNELKQAQRGKKIIKKKVVEQICPDCESRKADEKAKLGKVSRNIPVAAKKLMRVRYGEICAAAACQRPAEQIHHTKGFALNPNHDPKYLLPLCKAHHELEHSALRHNYFPLPKIS